MARICEIKDCERPHGSKGLCRTHYYAERRGVERSAMGKIKARSSQPAPNANGYVQVSGTYAHRLVMQGVLGRELLSHEGVHHKNGDRSDNHPDNLELWYVSQPRGQRVSDLIDYIAEHHADAMIAALKLGDE